MENTYTAKIYTLLDDKGEVFYVGVTVKSIEERVAAHLSQAKQNYPINVKTKTIRRLKYKISVAIVDTMEVQGTTTKQALVKAMPLEQKWIKHYRKLGCTLCNRAPIHNEVTFINNAPSLTTSDYSIY